MSSISGVGGTGPIYQSGGQESQIQEMQHLSALLYYMRNVSPSQFDLQALIHKALDQVNSLLSQNVNLSDIPQNLLSALGKSNNEALYDVAMASDKVIGILSNQNAIEFDQTNSHDLATMLYSYLSMFGTLIKSGYPDLSSTQGELGFILTKYYSNNQVWLNLNDPHINNVTQDFNNAILSSNNPDTVLKGIEDALNQLQQTNLLP